MKLKKKEYKNSKIKHKIFNVKNNKLILNRKQNKYFIYLN